MPYHIVFTREAKKDVATLDVVVKRQLQKKLLRIAMLNDVSSVAKKLHNHAIGGFRLRIGNYRLIFEQEKHTLIILRVQHRKDIYR